MSETEAFLEACDEQKRLLGKMRMLWAFHRLYAVDDVENHPGAKEWCLATIAADENRLKMDSLAKRAINSIRQANYDPAMLFELVESAGSWERFNQALEKNIPALRVAAVALPTSCDQLEAMTQPVLPVSDADDISAAALDCLSTPQRKIVEFLLGRKHSTTVETMKSIPGGFQHGESSTDRAVTAQVERINTAWLANNIPWTISTKSAKDSPRFKLEK